MVLGGGAHHGRAADVDELDRRVRGERVQVRDHEVDGVDAVGLQVGQVLGLGAVGQDPAVDLGVEGLDPPPSISGEPVTSATSLWAIPTSVQLRPTCCRWPPAPTPGPRGPGPARPGLPCRRPTAGPSRRHLLSSFSVRYAGADRHRQAAGSRAPASSSSSAQATVAGYSARSTTLIRSCSVSSVSPAAPGPPPGPGSARRPSRGSPGAPCSRSPTRRRPGRRARRASPGTRQQRPGACSGSGRGRPGARPRSGRCRSRPWPPGPPGGRPSVAATLAVNASRSKSGPKPP